MECNLILAGVGGQGILSIAQALSLAAVRRGWNIKQAEVHGMSQRGGAVQSHLRFADRPLHSDLIPLGRADMILSVEPLESLRYLAFLSEGGTIVSSSVPFVNIPNYPPIERVLDDVAGRGRHVLVDAERWSRAAGSGRAENMAMLGAASLFLDFAPQELEAAIAEMFSAKGAALVDVNRQAFRLGRAAAGAYYDGLRRGLSSRAVRGWLGRVTADELIRGDGAAPADEGTRGPDENLSASEIHAVAQLLERVRDDGRVQLYEHEAYALVELVGAISPPRHLFLPDDRRVGPDEIGRFRGDRVVLKLVSPDVVHKTEANALRFVPADADAVNRTVDELIRTFRGGGARVAGVLIVEFVEHGRGGFGKELFVGLRASREFGPVIAAGLGGVDTEYFAGKMKPGIAVAKALALDVGAERFFELFRRTAAYDVLAGRIRGHDRLVSDGELLRCFRAFIALARHFGGVDGAADGLLLEELEVNPFALVHQLMTPLDGRGRLGQRVTARRARPLEKVRSMIEPRSIAVMGVSATRENFGRIILRNIRECGFPAERLFVIKDQREPIDGARCIPDVNAAPEPIDLLVMAAGSRELPALIRPIVESDRVASVILIPGGIGEKEGTEVFQQEVIEMIAGARRRPDRGPVLLGGNCLGVLSHPGRYHTFFIPPNRLDIMGRRPPRRLALISQSGAFVITRMSNLETIRPTIAASVGNQVDLTVADLLGVVGERDDIDVIGVYVEGFTDLDGLAAARAVERLAAAGKTVIFYKAGRTPAGRSATMGHTASVAGDYDVCQSAFAQAGAVVTDTFKEFEQLIELATALRDKHVAGRRIAAISNAGYEAVGMADAVIGARYEIQIAAITDETRERLTGALKHHGLDSLVNARNPLDLTPMADDEAYETCTRVLLEADEVDAVVLSTVPLTAMLRTTPEELDTPDSFPSRAVRLFREAHKPIIAVVDSGPPFDDLAQRLRDEGLPVFRTCDQAVRSLGRYLCHRIDAATMKATPLAMPRREPTEPSEVKVG